MSNSSNKRQSEEHQSSKKRQQSQRGLFENDNSSFKTLMGQLPPKNKDKKTK